MQTVHAKYEQLQSQTTDSAQLAELDHQFQSEKLPPFLTPVSSAMP